MTESSNITQNSRTIPRISWLGAAALTVGGSSFSFMYILSSGLFQSVGAATVPLMIIGILISLLAIPGWLLLVLKYPDKVGGIGTTTAIAFRPYSQILGAIIGIGYWIGYAITPSIIASAFAVALQQYLLPNSSTTLTGIILLLTMAAVNLCGLQWVSRLAIIFALGTISLVLLSVVLPLYNQQINWPTAFDYTLNTPFPGPFGTFTSIMAGFYIIWWVVVPFEYVLCYVGQMKHPEQNAKKSIIASAFYMGICTTIVPLIWFAALHTQLLRPGALSLSVVELSSLYNGLGTLAPQLLAFGFYAFCGLSQTMAPLSNSSLVLAQLAEDGFIPAVFGKRLKNHVPWVALIASCSTSILFMLYTNSGWMIAGTNFDYIICIALASFAGYMIAMHEHPNKQIAASLGLIPTIIWLVTTIFGFEQFGLSTVISGIAFSFAGSLFLLLRLANDRRQRNLPIFAPSLQFKLTGVMVLVLLLDSIGYLIGIHFVIKYQHDEGLAALLIDIFVLVALITVSAGLIVPGMVVTAAKSISYATKQLIRGTLGDFSRAMIALGKGDLKNAYAHCRLTPINVNSRDEIGEMAANFNLLQREIMQSATGLNNARISLNEARERLIEMNETLEKRVSERTAQLELKNEVLHEEIIHRKKAESEIAAMHEQLIIASRHAGMADVATNVLHNVGNILNSLNTATTMIKEKVSYPEVDKINKLVTLLQDNKNDLSTFLSQPNQAQHLLDYLTLLSIAWKNDKEYLLEECHSLEKNIQYIVDIISTQQALGTNISIVEKVAIDAMVNDALLVNKNTCEKLNVQISRNYHKIKNVTIDKVKLLQILVNLIKNSLESLAERNINDRQLNLSIQNDNDTYFTIKITDNGVGFPPENHTKIFSYGYTTKQKGHGFGLHISALAASEMKGSLSAESKGENKGATFILRLPYQPVQTEVFS